MVLEVPSNPSHSVTRWLIIPLTAHLHHSPCLFLRKIQLASNSPLFCFVFRALYLEQSEQPWGVRGPEMDHHLMGFIWPLSSCDHFRMHLSWAFLGKPEPLLTSAAALLCLSRCKVRDKTVSVQTFVTLSHLCLSKSSTSLHIFLPSSSRCTSTSKPVCKVNSLHWRQKEKEIRWFVHIACRLRWHLLSVIWNKSYSCKIQRYL